ncbi:homoprotocatechuate degradation operon regulator HpaR [Vibrio sp. E150_011]|uniref:homoprotocatechuate degradation operon regulator HpaR n=1 Tax=Vibrio sp. 10N.261.51.F12 TaxID=3229679 RepID=UPI00354D0F9C
MTRYEDSLPLQLIRARDVAMEYFRPVLAENDITEQQWRVMRVLDTKGEIDFTTLSNESCILSPSLTGIIGRLEKLGYVQKQKSANDGRKFYIHLTPEAQQLVERLRPKIEDQYIALKARIGEEKYTQLSDLLNELITVKR